MQLVLLHVLLVSLEYMFAIVVIIVLGRILLLILAVFNSYYNIIIVSITCPEDILEGITYPATAAGSNVTVNCPAGFTGSKTRICSSLGIWETPIGSCGSHLYS